LTTEIELRNADVLKVGPDDRLIIVVDWELFDRREEIESAFMAALDSIGLENRVIVINKAGTSVELILIAGESA